MYIILSEATGFFHNYTGRIYAIIVFLRGILLFMGRVPEMKRRITSLCQSCDRNFLTSGLGRPGGRGPKTRKLETSLHPLETQCMQITYCLKPPGATVPENNVT